jgi:hypothetical protein
VDDDALIESNNKRLADLVEQVKASNDYIGISLVTGTALGHTVVHELRQTGNGCFLWAMKSSLGDTNFRREINLDLHESLDKIQQENPQMRLIKPFDNTRERYKTIFIATKNADDWIICQPPLHNNYSESATDKLFKAIFTSISEEAG